MNPPFEPINFNQLAVDIAKKGAFKDFDPPFPDVDPRTGDSKNQCPIYPGHNPYNEQSLYFANHIVSVPFPIQRAIEAHRQSVGAAIRLYMPHDIVNQWVHEYFSGDFLNSASFRESLKDTKFPQGEGRHGRLTDDLTMDFTDPQRKRTDRKLFTDREITITQQVCRKVPAIALAVLAYQSSLKEYLSRLEEAIEASNNLSPIEKERGMLVTARLRDNWRASNFTDNILPAVAIHYYKNHNGNMDEPPTEADFVQGMKFGYENGMFQRNITKKTGEPLTLTCPAKGILTRLSQINISKPEENGTMGTQLFHIYKAIDEQIELRSHPASRTVADITSKIDAAAQAHQQ